MATRRHLGRTFEARDTRSDQALHSRQSVRHDSTARYRDLKQKRSPISSKYAKMSMAKGKNGVLYSKSISSGCKIHLGYLEEILTTRAAYKYRNVDQNLHRHDGQTIEKLDCTPQIN